MPEQRTIELIQGRLDGGLDPAGEAELAAILAADPEARMLDDELGRVNEALAGIPSEEPPSNLVANVMSQVRSARRHAPLPFVDRSIERQRRRTLVARFGLGLAAAVAAVFVLVPSLRESVDPRHVSGTMIDQPAAGSTREIPMRGSRIAGTIRVITAGERVTLALAFDGEATREVRAAFDPAVLAIELPERMAGAPGSTVAAGLVTIEPEGRDAALQFVRKVEGPAQLSLSIVQGDDLYETTIELGK